MLTQAQREMRRTGVTASEASALVRWNPYRTAIEVWLSKPTPSRPPLLDIEDDDTETERQQVGTFLEDGLRTLVTERTGIKFRRSGTKRHRAIEHILATPDGLSSVAQDAGAEIKVVGAHMAHHWADDSIPDYVLSQAAMGMAVTGRSRWVVAALVGGTDFRIYTVARDLELEGALVDACSQFWVDNVLGDMPPEAETTAERRALIRARYPGSEFTKCTRVGAEEVVEAMRWLAKAKEMKHVLVEAEKALETMLCERIGAEYGIETSAGRMLWYPCRGQVDWKAIALELAGGAVDQEMIERHRGDGYRVPKFTPPKPTTPKRLR